LLAGSLGLAACAAVPNRFIAAMASDGFLEITAKTASKDIYRQDGNPSELWTYNGTSPGPEIRVSRGERVKVRLINKLEEPTSIHWHGIRIENTMDGVSGLTQEAVEPGSTFEYDFVVPDAGTFWYHAHNNSWKQVARGLYGPLIVEEEVPVFDRDHDITLVMDDWRLNEDGTLDVASLGSLMDWTHGGRLGNWLTVNGKSGNSRTLQSGEAYRFRIINASNARTLEIDPNRFDAKVLAYDGQPVGETHKLEQSPLTLASAQRVDLLVTPKAGGDFAMEELSRRDPFPFLNVTVKGDREAHAGEINLPPNDLPEPDLVNPKSYRLHMTGGAMGGGGDITHNGKLLQGADFRVTKQFWAFNGVANLAEKPFFSVKQGETVVIETVNDTAFAHAMHTHGHHFRFVQEEGNSVDETKPWRDTFLVGASETIKIAFVADNPGKWLLHCHMLEHAAAGMTTWFEVTSPV